MDGHQGPWHESVLRAAGGAEVRVFFGYLVDVSTDPNNKHFRLYLNLDLDDYIELPNSQILHSQRADSQPHPLGGTYVWVRRNAKLKRVGAKATEAQADFLRGEIEAELRMVGAVPIPPLPPPGTGYRCTAGTECPPCGKPPRRGDDY